jgi:hypothetical protein
MTNYITSQFEFKKVKGASKFDVREYASAQNFILDGESQSGDSHDSRESFRGSKTYQQVIDRYYDTPKVSDFVSELTVETSQGKEIQIKNSIRGVRLDFDAYKMERPDCFFNTVNVDGAGMRNVNLVFNIVESGSVSKEVIENKCALFSGMVNKLTTDGVNCQVWLLFASKNKGSDNHSITKIKVKDYFQDLSADMFNAFQLGIFRRGYFAFIEKYYPKMVDEGYGRPYYLNSFTPNELKEILGLNENEDMISFDSVSQNEELEKALKNEDKEYLLNHISELIGNTFDMVNSDY